VVLEATGPWRVEALVRTAAGEELVPLGEVEVHVDAHEAAHAPAPEAPSGGILFLFEQQWPLAMAFERAGPRPFVEQLAVSGRIEARPGAFAHVASLISGRVAAPPGGALPKPGQRVEAGDVIARVEQFLATPEKTGLQSLEYQQHQLRHELDLQQLEADRALSEARVRLQAGERVLERAERLRAESLGSQAEVDAARAEIELARAAQNAALSSLSSVQRLRNEHAEDPVVAASVFDLVAPIAGVLATVDLAIGESVEPGATLATVLDASIVWAVAEVPEHEIRRLENLGSARVLPRGLDLWLEAKKPVHVSPIVDPQTRFVEAAFEIENRDGRLRAGQLATVELAGDVVGDALSVPATSLFFEQGRPHVFVLHDGETFLKRRLKLGARDRDRVRVLAGLEAGEVIAATHAEELRLAALAGSGAIVEHHH
jgi:RND family efflux transporter MFP subunit